ncbi:MAG TPA: IS30 family transposase, partial [Acetobacteraceae bacterium]
GNANVTTLVERRSRFLVLLPNPDRRPAGVAERIQAALGGLAQDLRQTVTFDRGFEFMGYPALDRGLAVTSYICDPRSPWQKGAVEDTNGRLRRYLPSDVPAERLTAESLETLADRFNATPRCCLGYRTPSEVFEGRLDPIPAKCDTAAAVSHLA